MKSFVHIIVFVLSAAGCQPNLNMPQPSAQTQDAVQLFNEAVLRSSPTDSIPLLHESIGDVWTPHQVILDFKDLACYGAMVHYDKSRSFEELRAGFNKRFASHENATFADDPTMGLWRIEESQFAIQLTEDDESFIAIYICFVDTDTILEKIEQLHKTEPALFDPVNEVEVDK